MDISAAVVHELDVLKEHEKVIARLYAAYAARFPADRGGGRGFSPEAAAPAAAAAGDRTDPSEEPAADAAVPSA